MCVAGGISLEDGLRLIAARGRLMQALPPGGTMTSVMADEDLVLEAIAGWGEVAIAAINAPRQVVISGAGTAVAEVTARLTAEGIKTKALTVSHAFHSPLMKPMLAEYERVVRTIRFMPPSIPLVSCVDGALVSHEVTRPEYWLRQVMDPVRFAAGMRALEAQGVTAYIEIGPQPVLLGMGRQSLDPSSADVDWLPSLRSDTDAWQTMLGSLSALHVKGAPIDWKGFDAPYERRRVPVPSYPFRQKEYWLRGLDSSSEDKHGRSSVPAESHSGPRLYEVQWRQQQPLTDAGSRAGSYAWMIFADSQGVGDRLASLLVEKGVVPTVVTAGSRYAQLAAHRYEIDGSNAEHYSRLWSMLRGQSAADVRVVHLWSLDTPSLDRSAADAAPDIIRPIETLLHLSHAMAGACTTPALWCVTRGAAGVEQSSEDGLAVEQAPLWGFGRTLALEHPELWGGLIDLLARDSEAELLSLIDEVAAGEPEDQIALRGPRRYAARLTPREDRDAPPLKLRADAAYLVTGGGGALGLHVAQWLVERGARHLVLASRRGRADPQVQSVVQSLEALGATTTIMAADVSRAEDVNRLMTAIADLGVPLRGVVHAAGIDVPTPARELSVDGIRAVMAPKAMGSWLLHERTRDLPLDFFVLFSSVASVLGSSGRAHYGAANAFLDALALKRHLLGLPGLSVNWGPWKGGGMASDEQLRDFDRIGNRALDPDASLDSLEILTSAGDTQTAVVDIDWKVFTPVYESRRPRPLIADLHEQGTVGAEPEPGRAAGSSNAAGESGDGQWTTMLRSLPKSERGQKLEALLRAEVADTLGFDDASSVAPGASFYDIGMDSLMMAELVGRLNRRTGVPSSGLVFDHPTAESLTPVLLDRLALGEVDELPQSSGVSSPQTPTSETIGYRPELEDDIFAFQAQAWPHRNPDLIPSRWRWMIVESARRLGRAPIAWLHRDNGVIVGHMSAIPVSLKIGSEVRETAWCVETMVSESHRSRAVGSRLMLDARETLPFALSLGQTSEMRQICLRLGWRQIAPLQVAQRLERPENVLKGKLPAPAAWAAGLGLRATVAARQLLRKPVQLRAAEVSRFDERHDHLWREASRDLTCAVVRDASYLNWKYVDQPGQEFIRLEVLDGDEVRAVAVWMLREPDGAYRYRRAYLVDLVAPLADEALVSQVVRAACAVPTDRGADSLLCMHIGLHLTRALRECGFTLRQPERFLLVDPGPLAGVALEHVLSADNWYVTQGDSDIERPW